MRKRYILFTYDSYYPSGGLSDRAGDFDSLAEVKAHLETLYKTDVFERKFKSTKKGEKFVVTKQITQVAGPDYWEVLDLDTGDSCDYEVGFEAPKGSEIEIDCVPA